MTLAELIAALQGKPSGAAQPVRTTPEGGLDLRAILAGAQVDQQRSPYERTMRPGETRSAQDLQSMLGEVILAAGGGAAPLVGPRGVDIARASRRPPSSLPRTVDPSQRLKSEMQGFSRDQAKFLDKYALEDTPAADGAFALKKSKLIQQFITQAGDPVDVLRTAKQTMRDAKNELGAVEAEIRSLGHSGDFTSPKYVPLEARQKELRAILSGHNEIAAEAELMAFSRWHQQKYGTDSDLGKPGPGNGIQRLGDFRKELMQLGPSDPKAIR